MEETSNIAERLTPQMRRQLGSFYTPAPIVRYIASRCLSPFQRRTAPRILDPACGDGIFLEVAAQRILDGQTQSPAQRLAVVRDCLFGVDLHHAAVLHARERMLEFVSPNSAALADEAMTVLAANLKCGNALTGEGFSPIPDSSQTAGEFSWREAFPQIAAEGGFDIVIGNPPYRRELDAKELFDTIADRPLGKQWRQPRMDLWYYFLHRGLDLLKSDGLLSFIVGSYWTASSSARKLIARLERETTLREIVLLKNQKIFKDVQGRHLIFLLQKPRTAAACRVLSLENHADENGKSPDGLAVLENLADGHEPPPGLAEYEIPQAELYSAGRLTLTEPISQQHLFEGRSLLGELFETAQGMAENPPRINKRLFEKMAGQCAVGEGVFVLTEQEIAQLNLSKPERALLQPYYETAALGRYRIPRAPTHHVLYLTRESAPKIDEFPTIRRHLSRFRAIMEQRRETQKGLNTWWQLHWPRQERIFTQPAVLCVQMGKTPAFVFAEQPAYVGFSTNLILSGSPECCSLAALTGILNSALAAQWFSRHAKRRGVNLEINLNVLRNFPLPGRHEHWERSLTDLVRERQSNQGAEACEKTEARIDELVTRLYEGPTTGTAH